VSRRVGAGLAAALAAALVIAAPAAAYAVWTASTTTAVSAHPASIADSVTLNVTPQDATGFPAGSGGVLSFLVMVTNTGTTAPWSRVDLGLEVRSPDGYALTYGVAPGDCSTPVSAGLSLPTSASASSIVALDPVAGPVGPGGSVTVCLLLAETATGDAAPGGAFGLGVTATAAVGGWSTSEARVDTDLTIPASGPPPVVCTPQSVGVQLTQAGHAGSSWQLWHENTVFASGSGAQIPALTPEDLEGYPGGTYDFELRWSGGAVGAFSLTWAPAGGILGCVA
jgi:hypothetical protein